MKNSHQYLGFLLLFAVGLAVAGIAAGRLVVPVDGETPPLGAALVSAWADAAAVPFAGGFLLMLVGGIGARRLSSKEALRGAASSEDPVTTMETIKQKLSSLDVHSEHAPEILSEILEDLIVRVVDQRDRLIARHGVGAYAEFAGDFASFERNAARAWSAITDGVPDEAEKCLLSADAALERAANSFERLAAT